MLGTFPALNQRSSEGFDAWLGEIEARLAAAREKGERPAPYGVNLIVGYSHPVKYEAPKGIKISVENNTVVKIEGADKEAVGQVAAELRSVRPPEPYKGKGIRYQGEQVRRKAGKTGAK